ncbi:MAG: helix-turn-helix domain-containing protein [Limisphaerales bacterium]
MQEPHNIPKRLTETRQLAKLSQTDLAKRLEVSASLISYWESGTRKPSDEQLQEIARHLGVSLDYLLKEKIQPAFQFRSKGEIQETADLPKVQLDATAQIEYIGEIFKVAGEIIPQFLHMAEFSYPQLGRLAEHIRNTFRLNRRITLPGLKQAMAEQGIFVFEWNLPDQICGMSYRGPVTAVFINYQHQPTRRLFTLAHELAHLLFHVGPGRKQDENARVSFLGDNQDPEEREANAFASELLIPAADFEPLVQKHGDLMLDVAFMEVIARSFNVSRDAIFYRLTKLGLLNWKHDFEKYAAPFEKAEPRDHRVTDISNQVSPLLVEPAFSTHRKCHLSNQKLADWLHTSEATIGEYLTNLAAIHSSCFSSLV